MTAATLLPMPFTFTFFGPETPDRWRLPSSWLTSGWIPVSPAGPIPPPVFVHRAAGTGMAASRCSTPFC